MCVCVCVFFFFLLKLGGVFKIFRGFIDFFFKSKFVLKVVGFMGYIFDTTPKFLETRIRNTKRKTISKANFFLRINCKSKASLR